MSQENVEILKAGFEAWNAGDMDTVLALYVPEAILRMPDEGRIVYDEKFWDHAEALEAVGLSGQDAHADS